MQRPKRAALQQVVQPAALLGADSVEPASREKFDPRKDFLKNSDDGVLGDGSTSLDLPPPDIPGPAALV